MNQRLLQVQAAVLAIGTAFSWFTLVLDYRRFFAAGGKVLEVSACAAANPVLTPCFYGALAFLAAFTWAFAMLRAAPEVAVKQQPRLQWLLVAGTVFAWGNFAFLAYRYLLAAPAPAFSCPPGAAPANPLLAPCFYGALFFSVALGISVAMLRRGRARRTGER